MQQLDTFVRASSGKKMLIAVSGTFMAAWLVLHLAGNWTLFAGSRAADAYAAALRSWWPLLWLVRAALVACLAIHVTFSVQLYRRARRARPIRHAAASRHSATLASRTLRALGPLLAVFVLGHVLHLSFGAGIPGFSSERVHDNVVTAFSRPMTALVYVVAAGLVGLHLFHGLWSAPRSLGAVSAKAGDLRRPVVTGISVLIVFGFAAVPLAVLLGVIR
jgi:succinate dehydrogenase / fumarate reductase cytochrome b subunit